MIEPQSILKDSPRRKDSKINLSKIWLNYLRKINKLFEIKLIYWKYLIKNIRFSIKKSNISVQKELDSSKNST